MFDNIQTGLKYHYPKDFKIIDLIPNVYIRPNISGLFSAGVRHFLLALGCIVGASVQSSLLALTLATVECAVIPACLHVTWSPYICAGAVIEVCTCKYLQQSGLSDSISSTGLQGSQAVLTKRMEGR